MTQQLLARLSQVDVSRKALTREQAAELNRLFRQLIEQGDVAVPGIREFLKSNQDINFDALNGGEFVDFGSLRLGLLDALPQMGTTEAVQLSLETLRATADPRELALLARMLERIAPAQYRQQELTAARETLALAASGKWDGRDISALFELLQKYGDSSAVADLEGAVTRWKHYATLALAGLPEGAGISALIRLAQDPAVSALAGGDVALRPLAQVALQYPEAGSALIDLARGNRISDTAWSTVAATLGGAYIQYGQQIFGSTASSVNWSAPEIDRRIALIDQLLVVTSSAAGRQALQNARATLASKLPR